MIYVGYPCIGKSSISGIGKNIDLESSNFFYDVNGNGDYQRDSSWIEIYINIASDLSNQGFNIFISSHSAIIDELKKRDIPFKGIVPGINLEEKWIERARLRYEKYPTDKNKKALNRIESHFEEDVKALRKACGEDCIVIYSCDYDLNEMI